MFLSLGKVFDAAGRFGERNQGQTPEKLASLLSGVSEAVRAVKCPWAGDIGAKFEDKVAALRVPEVYTPDLNTVASYKTCILNNRSLARSIEYGPFCKNLAELVSARFHECVHAMQAPYDVLTLLARAVENTPVVVLPEDFIRMKLMKEYEAFAIEQWLMARFIDSYPDMIEFLSEDMKLDYHEFKALDDHSKTIQRKNKSHSKLHSVLHRLGKQILPSFQDYLEDFYYQQYMFFFTEIDLRWFSRANLCQSKYEAFISRWMPRSYSQSLGR
jgi:hypothetical protein